MSQLWQEIKAVLGEKDKDEIDNLFYRNDVQKFLKDLSDPRTHFLERNLGKFLETCRVMATRADEGIADEQFYKRMMKFAQAFEQGYEKLIDGSREDSEERQGKLRTTSFSIYKVILQSHSTVLMSAFHHLTNDDYMLWKTLSVTQHVEFYELLLDALPLVVLKETRSTHVLGVVWNSLLYNLFYRIIDVYNPANIPTEVQALLVRIADYATDRLIDEANSQRDSISTFFQIYSYLISRVCFQSIDFSVKMMPVLRKMINSSQFPPNHNLILISNNCMRILVEHGSAGVDDSMQQQIDSFLNSCDTDMNSVIPGLLLKVYSKDAELVHRNLLPLLSKTADMPVQHSMKIGQLMKEIAIQNPKEITKEMLVIIYPLLDNQSLCYFFLEAISFVSHASPSIIDTAKIFEFGKRNPMYIHKVSEVLTAVGTSKSTGHTKAGEIIEWLLQQSVNPVNFSFKPSLLTAAKAIGQVFKNELMLYKPLIETIHTDPKVKDITTEMLDYLDNRSLRSVDQKVEGQGKQIEEMGNEVAGVSSRVDNVETHVEQHKEAIKTIDAMLEGAIIDIERIDNKTVKITPKWTHKVAKLLDPESSRDWKLLAKRLGYTNEDLKAWATTDSPCMSVFAEWFATHITSEATRAVYVVLKEMSRDDAAEVVADALEMAGEMVPVDEPLDLKNPPDVFISYQWAVQEKAKYIKDHLANAGYSCWIDIGQMGGGDKLYEKINDGIRVAKVVVSLVTEKYAKSPNCNKEVSLANAVGKAMFPLLMEAMPWPPEGGMGPLFAEYLYTKFYLKENQKSDHFYPEASMDDLLMQLRHQVEPQKPLMSPEMRDWWCSKAENITSQAPSEAPEIFISYQWGNQKQVTELHRKLHSLGFSCWQDIDQMGSGDSLFAEIDKGIRACKVVISCVTQKYALSINCRREVSLASNLQRPIIPLRLEQLDWPPPGPMGPVLTHLHNIDFSEQQSLVTGDSFNTLLFVLGQHGIVTNRKLSKAVNSLAVSMKAYDKFKKPVKPSSPKSDHSKSCNVL